MAYLQALWYNKLCHDACFFDRGRSRMSEKRKDKRGRILRTGESQDKSGEYRFSYYEDGKKKNFRSWRLNATDPLPEGKRPCKSLREKEEEYNEAKRKNIKYTSGNITVNELLDTHIKTKLDVRLKKSTIYYYKCVAKYLKDDEFGKRKIKDITVSCAMEWMAGLQKDGKSYSIIYGIRSVLRSAFRRAVQDGLLFRNPFDEFSPNEVVINDTVKRDAISMEDEKRFLRFLKNDDRYSICYECAYVLLNTGMRISEFCGLTLDDIDMENRKININKQLQSVGGEIYIERSTKTKSGNRVIPMDDGVYEVFKSIVAKREENPLNPIVDGVGNFLYIDKKGNPAIARFWENRFRRAIEKYNKDNKNPLPNISPHVCRHTYCSKKAKDGINPVQLAYLMGHSNINITLQTYTHVKYEDALEELRRIGDINQDVSETV